MSRESPDSQKPDLEVTRRGFLRGAGAAGAGLLWAPHAAGAGKRPGDDTLNLAIIGCGSQGRVLLLDCLKMEGVRFKAACDIWDYHQRYGRNILKAYKQDVNIYTDYREMLASEKDLDAVIIATPDWMHAEQTIACLNAGLHVYCECEMARTPEEARRMVWAAWENGKLLQIGRQRRSSPRYLRAETIICEDDALGRITRVRGQWHHAPRHPRGWPEKYPMEEARLKEYGYDTMERFRDWRWYRKFCAGPLAYLGSHQIDVFNWFLEANPRSVQAKAGTGYYSDWEWWDSLAAIYEYETAQGTVIVTYDVANTTSYGGYYELFMGDERSMKLSEMHSNIDIYDEPGARSLPARDFAKREQATFTDRKQTIGYLPPKTLVGPTGVCGRSFRPVFRVRWAAVYGDSKTPCINSTLRKICRQHGVELPEDARVLNGGGPKWKVTYSRWPVTRSKPPYIIYNGWGHESGRDRTFDVLILCVNKEISLQENADLYNKLKKPVHAYHLENFIVAIRGQTDLNCPGETAYKTALTVFRTNEAAEKGKELHFEPDEFEI